MPNARRHLHPLLLLSAFVMGACTPEPEPEDAVCYDRSAGLGDSSEVPIDAPICDFVQPCAAVQYVANPSLCEVTATYDPAAGACIVDSLRSGAQALHRIQQCPGGQFSESIGVQVFGDGTALWRESNSEDDSGSERATWRALPDPAYFEACNVDTVEGLLDCLDAIPEQECQLGEPVCP